MVRPVARRRDLSIELAGPDDAPVYVRLAAGIVQSVRDGRLRPGAPLPGSRSLASGLGVHRNTVLAAYGELQAEGWVATEQARGTFVARDLPRRPRGFGWAPAGPPGRALFWPPRAVASPHAEYPNRYQLLGGVPDPRLVPVAELARAWRRALRHRGHLGYGDVQGHPRLRAAVDGMLAETRGLARGPESVLITRGAQLGIALAARALLSPGDAVAVEAFGYRPAWEALQLAGARLVPVPVDAAGLDVAALAAVHARERLRAVYLTPHHQYPTTVGLSPARRLALLDLAARERLLVLEDDYDNEFHYQGRPLLPLASADRAGVVVYVGTLSKSVAPALRLGLVVATPDVVERMVAVRRLLDRQGDLVLEAAMAELVEDGVFQRHVWRTRRAYEARQGAMVEALQRELGGALSFQVPSGGMALWCRTARGIDAEAWARRAAAAGVAVQHGRQFSFDNRPRNFLRIGFARHTGDEIAEAVRLLAGARG